MSIKELKNKISVYPDDANVSIKIKILDKDYNELDKAEENIESIEFIDYLNVDADVDELFLNVSYIAVDEVSHE
jgi:hypothetical protein